jgi:ketosteroid isomerase-like protein
MDDVYLINRAKSEFREAYNTGDVDRLLSVFADGLVDYSNALPSSYGFDARSALKKRSAALFESYHVRLEILIASIVVMGNAAYDRGFHEFTLSPKKSGEPVRNRERYLEIWQKDLAGNWKIKVFINNLDVPEELGGQKSTWFLSAKMNDSTHSRG